MRPQGGCLNQRPKTLNWNNGNDHSGERLRRRAQCLRQDQRELSVEDAGEWTIERRRRLGSGLQNSEVLAIANVQVEAALNRLAAYLLAVEIEYDDALNFGGVGRRLVDDSPDRFRIDTAARQLRFKLVRRAAQRDSDLVERRAGAALKNARRGLHLCFGLCDLSQPGPPQDQRADQDHKGHEKRQTCPDETQGPPGVERPKVERRRALAGRGAGIRNGGA